MDYKRLRFPQYFIDNSNDYNKTNSARRPINYKSVKYKCNDYEHKLNVHHEMNYEIFYEADRNVIQINFEKTNGKSDWFANIAEFSSKYYDSIMFENQKLQLRAHHGWAEMYKSIKKEIREEWKNLITQHPDAVTEIIGWSLGSSQAMLCAQDLNYNFGVKPYLYTFGSVRPFRYTPFNKNLMKKYLLSTCEKCFNFSDINDIVTYMPFFYGFTNINTIRVCRDKFSIARLFNPNLYHCSYDNPELYKRK